MAANFVLDKATVKFEIELPKIKSPTEMTPDELLYYGLAEDGNGFIVITDQTTFNDKLKPINTVVIEGELIE